MQRLGKNHIKPLAKSLKHWKENLSILHDEGDVKIQRQGDTCSLCVYRGFTEKTSLKICRHCPFVIHFKMMCVNLGWNQTEYANQTLENKIIGASSLVANIAEMLKVAKSNYRKMKR